MAPNNTPLRIPRSTHPALRGVRNSSSWHKVRNSVVAAVSASPTASTSTSTLNSGKNRVCEVFGANGELFVAFENVIEVYDLEDGHLVLVGSQKVDNDSDGIANITPIECWREECHYAVAVTSYSTSTKLASVTLYSISRHDIPSQRLNIPREFHENYPFTIKSATSYFSISTAAGDTVYYKKGSCDWQAGVKTSVVNGVPLIDLQGRWLAYVPRDPKGTALELLGDSRSTTPLKLPTSAPLFKRLVQSLSTTAIDGALKISELSGSALRSNSWSTAALLRYINSQNNGLKRSGAAFVVIKDLKSEELVALFAPPNSETGISRISLSPYDCHLATVNSRGDSIYVWDLARAPKEVSLVMKHTRGRTPAHVSDIVWNAGDTAIGITTRQSGSLHWFNNYGANDIRDWVLPNLKCTSAQLSQSSSRPLIALVGVSILEIDTEDGAVVGKYVLPENPSEFVGVIKPYNEEKSDEEHPNPLSNIELDPSSFYSPLHKNKNVQLSTYNFSSLEEGKVKNFFSKEDGLYITTQPLDNRGVYKGKQLSDDESFAANYGQFGSGFTVDVYHYARGSGIPVFYDEQLDGEQENDEDVIEEIGIRNLRSAMESIIHSDDTKTKEMIS